MPTRYSKTTDGHEAVDDIELQDGGHGDAFLRITTRRPAIGHSELRTSAYVMFREFHGPMPCTVQRSGYGDFSEILARGNVSRITAKAVAQQHAEVMRGAAELVARACAVQKLPVPEAYAQNAAPNENQPPAEGPVAESVEFFAVDRPRS